MRPEAFDPHCIRCPRLAAHLAAVRRSHPGYFAAPVPGFGPSGSALLVVGLAPGMHGANRTGRPFTGDHAGILLYRTLYRFGFANQPNGDDPGDGLRLINARITNAVRCLPPENKPLGSEARQCNPFLADELQSVPEQGVILSLGKISHDAVIRALGARLADHPFGHAADHRVGGRQVLDSYHCSRYNTQTRRLTTAMFEQVFARARGLCGLEPVDPDAPDSPSGPARHATG